MPIAAAGRLQPVTTISLFPITHSIPSQATYLCPNTTLEALPYWKMSQSLRLSQAISRLVLRNTSASRSCPTARPTLQVSYVFRRNLSTTLPRRAALASLPTQPTVILFTPSQADIEKEELDVELLPPEQVKLEITDRAAEVSLCF